MSNRFGIESPDEQALRTRDKSCVYCHKAMKTFPEIKAGNGDRRDLATIEHLNFDPPFYVKDGLRTEDIAICCFACNASRGNRRLWEWFTMPYCRVRDINVETVAQPVKRYLCEVPPELSQFVEFASWNFAKTYAETWPHEYVSRDHVDTGLFDALARCIFSRGYEGRYYQRMYIYFDYNGHSYWHIKDIINRCPTSETYERRERENRLPASPRAVPDPGTSAPPP